MPTLVTETNQESVGIEMDGNKNIAVTFTVCPFLRLLRIMILLVSKLE